MRSRVVAALVGAIAAAAILLAVQARRARTEAQRAHDACAGGESTPSWSSARGDDPARRDEAQRAHLAAPPPDGTTREALLQRDQQQRAEIARLRERVRGLENDLAAARGAASSGDGSFFNPSKDELLQMARDCKLKWDTPGLGLEPPRLGPKRAADFGLGDEDVKQVNRVTAETNARVLAELRQLYVEVTGDKAGADALTPQALVTEITAKSPDGLAQQVFWRLSQERAGLIPSPADRGGESPLERMMRMLTGLGDSYERDLGAAIGPDLAHSMRARNGGWSSRSSSSMGCPDQK